MPYGNRRTYVFLSNGDRETYLRYLRAYGERRGVAVWAYCLMTNHVHPVVVPECEASLAEVMRDPHTVYVPCQRCPVSGVRVLSRNARL